MKKFALSLLLALPLVLASASARDKGVPMSQLSAAITELSVADGVDVVQVGRLGTSLLKTLITHQAAEDMDSDEYRALTGLIAGIKKITIVDYDGCSDSEKHRFNRKLQKLLLDNVIMEVKDSGKNFKLCGAVDEKTDKISDFVMFAPDDCALICLFGTISTSSITALMNQ